MKLKSWKRRTWLMAVLSLSFVMGVSASEHPRGESVSNPADLSREVTIRPLSITMYNVSLR